MTTAFPDRRARVIDPGPAGGSAGAAHGRHGGIRPREG